MAVTVGRLHSTGNAVDVAAPAGVVFAVLADTPQWPLFVPSAVHTERLEFDGATERSLVWVLVDGALTSWVAHRRLDAAGLRVDFRHEPSEGPVGVLRGTWTVEPLGPGHSRATLTCDFTVADGHAADTARVRRATGAHAREVLAGVRDAAERWPRLDDLLLSFEDTARFPGPPEAVYDVLYRLSDWPALLPDVARIDVTERRPGVQVLRAGFLAADGSRHTAEGAQVCFPHAGRLVWKHTLAGGPVAAHTGEWTVVPDGGAVTVVGRHRVLLSGGGDLGGGDLGGAREHVRDTLRRRALAVLDAAGTRARSAHRSG
ncbi:MULTISPECIES: aromatase/cyclase [Streptomyces]|uniref:aromatase/cyclase n=1 Tax=Streptomyces TaxID=1883 RepID=UPI00224879C9|nr:SRPBCC family protein [Streptomyces sp. JHD 1]MCX2968747.1 SRPBCC family protein [Streptomyces sp. JHD 1]